jgi:hypothetical protein
MGRACLNEQFDLLFEMSVRGWIILKYQTAAWQHPKFKLVYFSFLQRTDERGFVWWGGPIV